MQVYWRVLKCFVYLKVSLFCLFLMDVEFCIDSFFPPSTSKKSCHFFQASIFFSLQVIHLSDCYPVYCLFLLLLSRFSFYDMLKCAFYLLVLSCSGFIAVLGYVDYFLPGLESLGHYLFK